MKKFVPPRKLTSVPIINTDNHHHHEPLISSSSNISPLETVASDIQNDKQAQGILREITHHNKNNHEPPSGANFINKNISNKTSYYSILYTKSSNKKHKTYEDGILVCIHE